MNSSFIAWTQCCRFFWAPLHKEESHSCFLIDHRRHSFVSFPRSQCQHIWLLGEGADIICNIWHFECIFCIHSPLGSSDSKQEIVSEEKLSDRQRKLLVLVDNPRCTFLMGFQDCWRCNEHWWWVAWEHIETCSWATFITCKPASQSSSVSFHWLVETDTKTMDGCRLNVGRWMQTETTKFCPCVGVQENLVLVPVLPCEMALIVQRCFFALFRPYLSLRTTLLAGTSSQSTS